MTIRSSIWPEGPGDGLGWILTGFSWWWDFIDDNAWLRARDLVLVVSAAPASTEPQDGLPGAAGGGGGQLALGVDCKRRRRSTATPPPPASSASSEGHDPTEYTRPTAPPIFMTCSRPWGRPKWNVYGLSYGTGSRSPTCAASRGHPQRHPGSRGAAAGVSSRTAPGSPIGPGRCSSAVPPTGDTGATIPISRGIERH